MRATKLGKEERHSRAGYGVDTKGSRGAQSVPRPHRQASCQALRSGEPVVNLLSEKPRNDRMIGKLRDALDRPFYLSS